MGVCVPSPRGGCRRRACTTVTLGLAARLPKRPHHSAADHAMPRRPRPACLEPTSRNARILSPPRATPITRTPIALPSCTAARPTPPAAPSTSSVWPAHRGPRRCGAVCVCVQCVCVLPLCKVRNPRQHCLPAAGAARAVPRTPACPARTAHLTSSLPAPSTPARRYRTPLAGLLRPPNQRCLEASLPGGGDARGGGGGGAGVNKRACVCVGGRGSMRWRSKTDAGQRAAPPSSCSGVH